MDIIDGVRRAFERPVTEEGDRASDVYRDAIDLATSGESSVRPDRMARRINRLNELAPKLGDCLLLEGQFTNYHNAAAQVNQILDEDPATADGPRIQPLI